MHSSSYKQMKKFVENYLKDETGLIVVDVGSLDINGNYKDLFENQSYIGVDIVKGNNVDVVLNEPDNWEGELPIGNIDVVISGQTLPFVNNIENFIGCIANGVKDGGLVCLIAPNVVTTKNPRIFTPNDLKEMFEMFNFEILECFSEGVDSVIICRKNVDEITFEDNVIAYE